MKEAVSCVNTSPEGNGVALDLENSQAHPGVPYKG